MEELLGSQDGGHLCLEPTLAAGDAQQVPRGLAGGQGGYLLLHVHLLHQRPGWIIIRRYHYTCLLPLGSGTYSPGCVSVRVPVLAAGITTVPHPCVV